MNILSNIVTVVVGPFVVGYTLVKVVKILCKR